MFNIKRFLDKIISPKLDCTHCRINGTMARHHNDLRGFFLPYDLFNNPKPEPADHVLKYTLSYLGMRKIAEEKIEKIRAKDDNM